jgi:hypothetical protein
MTLQFEIHTDRKSGLNMVAWCRPEINGYMRSTLLSVHRIILTNRSVILDDIFGSYESTPVNYKLNLTTRWNRLRNGLITRKLVLGIRYSSHCPVTFIKPSDFLYVQWHRPTKVNILCHYVVVHPCFWLIPWTTEFITPKDSSLTGINYVVNSIVSTIN